MNSVEIKAKLIHAVTEYNRKQLAKTQGKRAKGYNPNALGIYFNMVDSIMEDVENGADLRKAIIAGFLGRLQDACLREFGLTIAGNDEQAKGWSYSPTAPRK